MLTRVKLSHIVKRAVNDLIKEGKVVLKKTLEDDHVALNPRLKMEIEIELYNSKKVY